MQDRFKFRLWDKEKNFMITKDKYDETHKIYGDEEVYYCLEYGLTDPFNYYGNFIVLQSTGLRDKNGKLIYEGDIVKVTCMHEKMGGLYYMLMQVIYEVKEHGNDTYSGFSLKHKEKGVFALWGSDKTEVIGNIYENLELLESN